LDRLIEAVESEDNITIHGGKYYDIACINSCLGNIDDAIKYLTLAKENQKNGSFFFMPWVLSDPMFENIRGDARFKKLIEGQIQKEQQFKHLFREKVDSLQMNSNLAWVLDK